MRRSAYSVVCMILTAASAQAQQTTLTAAPSTRVSVVVTLNPPRGTPNATPARIRIDHGQPHLRGRALHTGGLVPLDTVWRLGANEATQLETDVDLTIGGHAVPKGKYSLYALPSSAGWKLIVNKNTGQWGTEYDATHDLARIDLRKRALTAPLESFSIWLVPAQKAGAPSGKLRLAWGDTELSTDWNVVLR